MRKITIATLKSLLGVASILAMANSAEAVNLVRTPFGVLKDGTKVEAITLQNKQGVSATFITYGAGIQSVILPDAKGVKADIALGYKSLDDYINKPQYIGSTVGRFANRIAKGQYVIDGKTYNAPLNNGANSLHGGTQGFDKVNWKVVKVSEGDIAKIEMEYNSPDGDMGYPGALKATAIYSLDEQNQLSIIYKATTKSPTIVNITNHAYWNLAGEGSDRSINEQQLQILGDAYLPTDAGAIPTGEIRKVEGTVFDFRQPMAIGKHVREAADQQIAFGRGYDHNWIISMEPAAKPRLIATVNDPVSGRGMKLYSDQPGLQFYSGNFLDGTTTGKAGNFYREGDAFVLEPQKFPDAPNQSKFASTRLNPGQVYSNTIIYKLCSQPNCP